MSSDDVTVTDRDRAAARASFAGITTCGADHVGLERNIALALAQARSQGATNPFEETQYIEVLERRDERIKELEEALRVAVDLISQINKLHYQEARDSLEPPAGDDYYILDQWFLDVKELFEGSILPARPTTASTKTAQDGRDERVLLVSEIINDVCELDYESPPDNPTLLTCTTEELGNILRNRLGGLDD